MTRYEFLYRISEILAPKQTEEFFDYLLHSSDDDGGFLRTRWCYWENPLPDSNSNYQVKIALITMRSKYDFDNLPSFYDEDGKTNVKIQVHFGDYSDDDAFYQETLWASSVGFPYPVKIDFVNGMYEVSEFRYEKSRHYIVGQPKYSLGDSVRFRLFTKDENYKIKDGTIRIVDAYGTLGQQEEPSYDIEVVDNNEVCLCKHIKESDIVFRHRIKSLKTYLKDEN